MYSGKLALCLLSYKPTPPLPFPLLSSSLFSSVLSLSFLSGHHSVMPLFPLWQGFLPLCVRGWAGTPGTETPPSWVPLADLSRLCSLHVLLLCLAKGACLVPEAARESPCSVLELWGPPSSCPPCLQLSLASRGLGAWMALAWVCSMQFLPHSEAPPVTRAPPTFPPDPRTS